MMKLCFFVDFCLVFFWEISDLWAASLIFYGPLQQSQSIYWQAHRLYLRLPFMINHCNKSYKMQAPQNQLQPQSQTETQKATVDLIEADDSLQRINNMKINKMEQISLITRANRAANKADPTLNKKQSMDFEKQLNIDMLIDRILGVLLKTKVEIMGLQERGLIEETQKTKAFIQYFEEECKKYHKTLMMRQSQIGALVYVIEHKKDQDFKAQYLATYGEIEKFIIPVEEATKPINAVILEETFETQIQFLKDYSQTISQLKQLFQTKKYDMEKLQKKANRLKIINSKIVTIAQVFPYACILDKNDLFSFKKTSQRWHNLLQNHIRYKFYGDKETIRKSFEQLRNGLNLVNATMSIMHKTRGSWTGTAKDFGKDLASLAQSTGKVLKCLIFKQQASHEAELLISDPDGRLAKEIWNLPQQKMLRNLVSSTLPSIAFCQQIWIPRIHTQRGHIEMPTYKLDDVEAYLKTICQAKDYKQRLPMRINSPINLTVRSQKSPEKSKNKFESFISSFQKEQKPPTSVIFHIHGGGFISMSSFVHQAYSRIWANNLKVPIVSVDYGKAPQYPYPAGLYDCFEGYMWTLQIFKQVYNVQPQKIILVGDSAGGNLVAALTNLLISFKQRLPDGLVLVYPALNLNYNNYTPSLLTSLNDMILPHTFLKICLQAYLPEGTDAKNLFVSPINSSDEYLKKYPPTRIFVGNCDPFHDDCCRLTERLNGLEKDKAKLMIFDEFPHGFLQFDMKTQPHQSCRKATKQVQNALGELLGL